MYDGIELSGKNWIMDALKITLICSGLSGNPITIESQTNFTIRTTNKDNNAISELFLGDNRLESLSDNFEIYTTDDLLLLAVNRNEIVFGGAESLSIDDQSGGSIFHGYVDSEQISSTVGKGVTFESPTKSIGCIGEHDLKIKSLGGGIVAKAYNELKLLTDESIILNATNIRIPMIGKSIGDNSFLVNYAAGIHQICSCENGRLYLLSPHLTCNIGSLPNTCD